MGSQLPALTKDFSRFISPSSITGQGAFDALKEGAELVLAVLKKNA
jgi:hypothetical protein